MAKLSIICLLICLTTFTVRAQKKAVFIIVDGIPEDVVRKLNPPSLADIAGEGGMTKAYVGGMKDGYSQSPTISAVGYNHVLTGVWTNKHNVWDNDIKEPNYHYWNVFRILKEFNPSLRTAIFSTWLDNRTKLAGDQLKEAGAVKIDYAFDGFELDTVRFPHKPDRKYIADIDQLVSDEASRYILEKGPDLSWVYLEFTDDIGHAFGDSQQFHDAIRSADAQLGTIWNAVRERERKTGEEWLVIVTTDHGRDLSTGKDHGGQSDRERTTWIATNAKDLNDQFREVPGAVDIAPTLLRHLQVTPAESTRSEMDGIPFIGDLSVRKLQAHDEGKSIKVTWIPGSDTAGEAEILLATTNNFKTGTMDNYVSLGKVKVSDGEFMIDIKKRPSKFYKILVKAPNNWGNVWIVR